MAPTKSAIDRALEREMRKEERRLKRREKKEQNLACDRCACVRTPVPGTVEHCGLQHGTVGCGGHAAVPPGDSRQMLCECYWEAMAPNPVDGASRTDLTQVASTWHWLPVHCIVVYSKT